MPSDPRLATPRRWRRNVRRVEALALVPALVTLSVLPVLRPSTDPPAPADAVIVLSGDPGERRDVANSLIDRGLVRTLVFAGTPDRQDEDQLCQVAGPTEYICLRPQPDSTRAEARAVARLVEERQWRRIIVVTSRFHVARSRLLFRRCVDAEVRMMGGDPSYGRDVLTRRIANEWPKVVYTSAMGPGC